MISGWCGVILGGVISFLLAALQDEHIGMLGNRGGEIIILIIFLQRLFFFFLTCSTSAFGLGFRV